MQFKRRNFFIILIIIILIICGIFAYINASSIITKICSSEINAKINDIINESNDIIMSLDLFYADYFTPLYDKDNNITGVLANTGLINQMTIIWNTEIQNRLNSLRNFIIEIPMGAITGSPVLAQYGREINLNANVVSNCAITYESQFIHSGINRTLHRLVLYTEVIADVSVPINAGDIKVTQEIILAETVLQGDVPNSYLIGEESLNYLDLINK